MFCCVTFASLGTSLHHPECIYMQSIYIKMYERNGNLVCYILSVGTNVCSGRLSSVVVAGFERLQTDVSADLFRLIKLSLC